MSASVQDWIAGARPRTLWSAITPVAVGTASAIALDSVNWLLALLALGVSVALQVGVNYANDYSDGIRGTDVDRIGPDRLVATGRARPSSVKNAAFIAFGTAALLGLAVVWLSGYWWLLAVGAVAILAAWYYTGSSRPYGYAGWGEISVFIFFGPVATLGTLFVQAGEVPWWAAVASVALGLYAVAMLLVNNIRDIETDTLAGKRTAAVRMGDYNARRVYGVCMLVPVALAVVVAFEHPWALLSTLVALPALLLTLGMRIRVGGAMVPLFLGTSGVGLAYGLLLAFGIAI